MKRVAVLTATLALALTGCGGGGGDDPAVAAAGTGSAAPTTSAPTPSTTPSSTASAAAQKCPITAKMIAPPVGAQKDLKVKPTIAARSTPPPKDVEVADIVVGTGAAATSLSTVAVKYVGAFYQNGKEFDSSWKTSPTTTLPFTICAQGVVPGFAIAPTGMKVGGRREVIIPPDYGYGAQGQPPTIPANSTLVFVIDLVKVTPPAG